MTIFELEYRKFERNIQRYQLSNTFQFIIEEIFETLETAYVDTIEEHYSVMIEAIVNIKFGNTFHNQNGPNQIQNIHNHTSHQYQS